jgi:hypothetical protein
MRSLVLAVSTAAVAVAVTASSAPDVNDRARLVKEFEERAAIYSQLSRKAAATLPPLPDKATPEQIAEHQKALAKAIQAGRAGAFQGEILFDGVVPVFLDLLRSDLTGPKGKDARETIKDGDPRTDKGPNTGEPKPKEVQLVPNAPYPQGAALSTVPPDLLAKLPKLPKPLEYRFVGGHLILHDTEASLVVDYLKEVVA